jgi:hypothetical protein
MSEYTMPPEIVRDERPRAMAAIACWLERDKAGFDAVVGTDEETACLLPVVIGELCGALERLVGLGDLRLQVGAWLDAHREGHLAA